MGKTNAIVVKEGQIIGDLVAATRTSIRMLWRSSPSASPRS